MLSMGIDSYHFHFKKFLLLVWLFELRPFFEMVSAPIAPQQFATAAFNSNLFINYYNLKN